MPRIFASAKIRCIFLEIGGTQVRGVVHEQQQEETHDCRIGREIMTTICSLITQDVEQIHAGNYPGGKIMSSLYLV
ncbi:hypothetical protein PILCRDRAFT_16456 [Piloderma croceum F 1598]|uniref:Uncharacterized protein n=1 Tax=Piloderma croceum (strain F 1598) TaxID=765440 RepID=A0A0C3EW84_PILCF|nr:hypothetical protein PILCRDRAFT_16456 [Piloderma croceum F 1598]